MIFMAESSPKGAPRHMAIDDKKVISVGDRLARLKGYKTGDIVRLTVSGPSGTRHLSVALRRSD